MPPNAIVLNSVVACYERSREPLALICSSHRIRMASEEVAMVVVGPWGLRLQNDGSRSVTWQPVSSSRYSCMANMIGSVVWWCNRFTLPGGKALPTRVNLSTAGRFIKNHLHVILDFRSLVELTLRHAPLTDVNVLGKLPLLAKLDLVQTAVVDSGIVGLGESRSLIELNLWGCEALTSVNILSRIPTLKKLILSETLVWDGGISGLGNSSSITELSLEACAYAENVGFLGELPQLHRLLLVATPVKDNSILGLCCSSSLIEIDLWGCEGVTDVNSLGKVLTLRKLNLFGTSVRNEGIVGLGESSSIEEIDFTLCVAVSDVSILSKIMSLRLVVLFHTSVQDVSKLTLLHVTVLI